MPQPFKVSSFRLKSGFMCRFHFFLQWSKLLPGNPSFVHHLVCFGLSKKSSDYQYSKAEITTNSRVILSHGPSFQLRAIFNSLNHFIFDVVMATCLRGFNSTSCCRALRLAGGHCFDSEQDSPRTPVHFRLGYNFFCCLILN